MNNFLDSTSEKILSFFRKRKEKHRFSFAVLNDVIVQRWVIAVLLSAGLTALLAPQFYSSKPVYRHGMIVQENVKADRDFLVEDVQSTRLKQLESAAAVRPVYDYDPETAMTIRAKIKQSFALAAGQRETSQVKALLDRSLGVTLSQEEFAYLSAHAFSDELLQRFSRIIFAFYENTFVTTGPFGNQEREKGITIVNTLTRTEENTKELSSILLMKDIGPALSKKINASMRNEQPEARRVTFLFLKKMIAPNLTYNPKATAQKIASARESVKPVYFQVQKNEMIVREGDKIGYPELAKLEAFHKTAAVSNISSLAVLAGIFCIVLFLTLLLYFWRTRNWLKTSPRSNVDFLVFAIVALLQILFVKAGIFISVAVNRAFPSLPVDACYFAIPFAMGAMIIAVLVNRNVAMIMSVLSSFLISLLFEEKILFPLFSFLGSVAASYHVVNSRQRSTFLKVGVFLGVVNIAAILSLNLLTGRLLDDLILRLAMGLFGGIITGILVAGLTPVFESLFGFITYIKLLELANLNQPLFQKMIIEAPGTYHHSIIVASLVESAAEAIGANALLAKVSAYYHDIGKLAKPHYYIENQTGYDNRHDKLSPKMSALIIISHVKEGCELATQAKLGQPIINIIREHHGTSLISYFFDKAKKNKDESIRSLTESDFRYPGPKPQTKEAGLVMLGDVIEASSRTLTNPTPARIRSLVRERIARIYTDGQLDECELTLRNLNTIAETFTRILTGIFHHRVEYPEAPPKPKETNGKREVYENSNRKPAEADENR
ncbi:MAG TPA: HDIG domain-containing protein [Smithellaceae bacterium]|nr:HDIG domain-containing protein [Smithellaceae bacterium]HPI50704.1 HDIG domain-containing protein [Smithellaceae bacterium]HQN66154.1 HDIG domain-containing protein [Smithellaceae bacterium]